MFCLRNRKFESAGLLEVHESLMQMQLNSRITCTENSCFIYHNTRALIIKDVNETVSTLPSLPQDVRLHSLVVSFSSSLFHTPT
jgi:hypothetical protein